MLLRILTWVAVAGLVGCEAGEPNYLPADGTVSDAEGSNVDNGGAEGDSVAPPTGPEASCTTDDDCSDGIECTDDTCVDGTCAWTLQDSKCLIDNVCYAAGGSAEDLPCVVCSPETEAYAWSKSADGVTCDDGDFCTEEDVCAAGLCVGIALTCEAAEDCASASCDPAIGCVVIAGGEGEFCDDGNACTADDLCTEGACTGSLFACNDSDECTEDSCDPVNGCIFTWTKDAPCDDGNACTGGDVCGDDTCEPGTLDGCDDQNACTVDVCEPGLGCGYIPVQSPCCTGQTSVCDDGDPCTVDGCDLITQACSYTSSDDGLPCDDGDACTTASTCVSGVCTGATVACDDGNPCTTDSCDSASGACSFGALSGIACDDGLACSTGDACIDGQCVADTSECGCEPTTFGAATKMVSLAIGSGGIAGQGLDVDGNPNTCAPSNNCSGGIDNAFSVMGSFMNAGLVDSLNTGELMLLSEFIDGNTKLLFHQAQLAPENLDCDFMSDDCQYVVALSGYDSNTCAAAVQMDVTLDGTSITAGGPGSILPFQVPLPGASLELPLYNVQIKGQVTLENGKVTALSGLMGGAIEKTALLASIDALPEEGLPVPKASIKAILDLTLEYDTDTNGDGTLDGASIGFPFSAVSGQITGVFE